ncbi:MAG: hypothetical protein ABR497_12210 [Kiritimatiellia bacterium]
MAHRLVMILLLAGAWLCYPMPGLAEVPGAAGRRFLWQEAQALAATADDPDAWRRVALVYRQLEDEGLRNAALFYNQGVAWLQAGENELALAALLRAERYQGSDPDLERNLKIALARRAGRDEAAVPWYRVLFAWHFRFSVWHRMQMAFWSFCGIWIGLSLMRLRRRGLGRFILTVMVLIWMLSASSCSTSLYQEFRDRDRDFEATLPPELPIN